MINTHLMRTYFIFLFIIFAKIETACCQQNSESFFDPRLSGRLFINDSKILGNQFLLKDWFKSEIKFKNGIILRDKYLNYNGYLDKFIWVNDINLTVVLDDYDISEISIYTDSLESMVFKKILFKNDYQNDSVPIFAQLISFDRIKLYAYHQIVKDGSVEISNDKGVYRKIRVEYKPIYFFVFPDGTQVKFSKLSNRKIIDSFGENLQEIVKKTIKINNVRIKSELDLIKFNILLNKEIF